MLVFLLQAVDVVSVLRGLHFLEPTLGEHVVLSLNHVAALFVARRSAVGTAVPQALGWFGFSLLLSIWQQTRDKDNVFRDRTGCTKGGADGHAMGRLKGCIPNLNKRNPSVWGLPSI